MLEGKKLVGSYFDRTFLTTEVGLLFRLSVLFIILINYETTGLIVMNLAHLKLKTKYFQYISSQTDKQTGRRKRGTCFFVL